MLDGTKQKTIREFFGYEAQMGKYGKLDEEMVELIQARSIYTDNPTQETLKHLLNELGDALNVAEGEYVYNGGCLHEIASEKELKLYRCIKIINQIPEDTKQEDRVKEYDRIRREK